MRLEVPLFQRQYVWGKDQQWAPLWEDISRKFGEYLEGNKDRPVHFLGAMVLDQKQTPTTHVEKRQVIDGQQRLTTFQIFLSAFRTFCAANECPDLARECESFILNKGMMADPELDRFKVWPTQTDRNQYRSIILTGSREELIKQYPLTRKKWARKPEARPRMVEAYLFFYDEISEFFLGSLVDEPIMADQPLPQRLEESFQALKSALQVVVIDLSPDDDAQVIFETLNARGEPLLPADLLRNYIFLRAARQGESQDDLYEDYWKPFDDSFWRQEATQGRLSRPRSDLFMQHFLASRQAVDIPIKHLFVEYKYWIERAKPFAHIRDELAAIARQREDFRRILSPQKSDPIFPLLSFLSVFEMSTSYPFLLSLMAANMADSEWIAVSRTLESYLVRRAVCGLGAKNYNRVFLQLTKTLRDSEVTAARIQQHLGSLAGDSGIWPTNDMFRTAWMERHAYRTLNNPKIVHILRRLSDAHAELKHESIVIDGPLSVEHIMPQSWIEHWPLPDGSSGMSQQELWAATADDQRAEATRRRNVVLQTIGNLTIITQSLNAAASNAGWASKRPELLKHSLLPINQSLHEYTDWNEEAIMERGKRLLEHAVEIWPGPPQQP